MSKWMAIPYSLGYWQDLIQKFKATVVSFTHIFHFLLIFHLDKDHLNTNSWYTTFLVLICFDQKNEWSFFLLEYQQIWMVVLLLDFSNVDHIIFYFVLFCLWKNCMRIGNTFIINTFTWSYEVKSIAFNIILRSKETLQ